MEGIVRERLWDNHSETLVESKNSICVHLQMWTANNEVADVDSKIFTKLYAIFAVTISIIKAKQHVMHRSLCTLHKECLHSFQRSEMLVRVSVEVKWYQQQFLMEQQHHLLHLQTGRVGLQNECIELLLG